MDGIGDNSELDKGDIFKLYIKHGRNDIQISFVEGNWA